MNDQPKFKILQENLEIQLKVSIEKLWYFCNHATGLLTEGGVRSQSRNIFFDWLKSVNTKFKLSHILKFYSPTKSNHKGCNYSMESYRGSIRSSKRCYNERVSPMKSNHEKDTLFVHLLKDDERILPTKSNH